MTPSGIPWAIATPYSSSRSSKRAPGSALLLCGSWANVLITCRPARELVRGVRARRKPKEEQELQRRRRGNSRRCAMTRFAVVEDTHDLFADAGRGSLRAAV